MAKGTSVTSAVVQEVLAYVKTGILMLGLQTYITLDVEHTRDCPWTLLRIDDRLRFTCSDKAVLDEVVAAAQAEGYAVDLTEQADTVHITPASS
jgi:hypothetical protein